MTVLYRTPKTEQEQSTDLEEWEWSYHKRLRTRTPSLRAVRLSKGLVQERDVAEVTSIAGWAWENVSQNPKTGLDSFATFP